MEPDGSALWSRRYTADVPFWPDLGEPKLLLSRAAPMGDGTMLVAAYPYTLLRLDLAGELLSARRFMKEPFKETWLRFTDLVGDGANGFYLVGHIGESYSEAYLHDAWLLRLDQDGDALWSRRLAAPGLQLTARALVPDNRTCHARHLVKSTPRDRKVRIREARTSPAPIPARGPSTNRAPARVLGAVAWPRRAMELP